MERPGIMAPPVLYESRPLLACSRPVRAGVMAPGPHLDIDHAAAIRALLWVVAAVLGLVELLLLTSPSS
ncbi:MAG TPA: hypothetical protein VE596_01335 [Gaiellaceae bacterium]|nr:hypothetical protein [Gaiellaceae bacterium]